MTSGSRLPEARLEAIRAPFRATGATWVQPPVLQPLSLVLDLAGEALRSRLFVLQAAGGDEVCLRPDFTTPVARLHLASGASAGDYAYEGLVFRASTDEPEEILQVGIERFAPDVDRVEADAGLVDIIWRAALAGGRGDLSLRLGDAGLFPAFVDTLGLPVLGHLRDTQVYIQLAARGLTLFDIVPTKVPKDLEQWQPICQWLDR